MRPMHGFLNPEFLAIELIYFFIVVVICIEVFFKTREIYDLTKNKGIRFFRSAFLFFALAYLFRLVSLIFIVFLDVRTFMPFAKSTFGIGGFLISYLSSLAILYLTTSLIWKKFDKKINLDLLINFIALSLSLIVFFSMSPEIMIFVQLFLFVFAVLVSLFKKSKKKSFFSGIHITYALLFLFWVINLASFTTHLPREFKIVSYLVSSVIFVIVYFKVMKGLSCGSKKG